MPKDIDKKTFWLSCTAGIVLSMLLSAGMSWSMWFIADENKDSRLILFWLASVMGGLSVLFFIASSVIWNRYTLLILHSALFIVACVCALTTVILLYSENAEYIKNVAIWLSAGFAVAVAVMVGVTYYFYEGGDEKDKDVAFWKKKHEEPKSRGARDQV